MLAVCEGLGGRTPGKLLFGLRVVDRRGGKPGLGPALTRNLLCWGSWALSSMVSPLVTVGVNLGLGGFWPLTWGLYGVSMAWFLLALLSWLFMRPDPFWDRAAGVNVVGAGRS